jgi:hypothetical protein
MATLAQSKRSVKDSPAASQADTTANEYMQELPESVGRRVESMYEQLMDRQAAAGADLLPIRMGDRGPKHVRKGPFGLSFRFADNHVSLGQEKNTVLLTRA